MSEMAHDLLQQVERLAREAGQIALDHYGQVTFELKGDASPVSVADREVEVFLRDGLAQLITRS